MTPDERWTIVKLLACGERYGTWSPYLHTPKFRHLEDETSAAIRATYALVGVDVGKAHEEHYIEPLEGL